MKLLLALILLALALGGSSAQADVFGLGGFACKTKASTETVGVAFETSTALGSKVAKAQKDCFIVPQGHALLARNATVVASFHQGEQYVDLVQAEAFGEGKVWKPVFFLRPRPPGTFES